MAKFSTYFTLDVITKVAFGEAFGCLQHDANVSGFITELQGFLPSGSFLSYIPSWLYDTITLPLNYSTRMDDGQGVALLGRIARESVKKQFEQGADSQKDMLGAFMRYGMSFEECRDEATFMIAAGSDTTSSVIRCTMVHLMTNPRAYQTLKSTVKEAISQGNASWPITQKEGMALPYLRAVIFEGLRMRAAAPSIHARVAPDEGEEICGKFIPAGTGVGTNVSAMLLNPSLFGADAAIFRPERFLEAEKLGGAISRLRMERDVELVFGYGRWQCAGKTVALMELSKECSIRAAEAASPPPSADRWAAALQRLDSKDRERYQLAVIDQTLEPSVILKDVLAAAIAKKDECLKKRWKLVIGDRTVVVRDVLEKTAVWIEKFIEIGTIGVSYDPVSAALPWAGVKLLMQAGVNDVESFCYVLESLEKITNIISRCKIVEALHLSSPSTEPLSNAVLDIYTMILGYLCRVLQYYATNTVVRVIKSTVTAKADLAKEVEQIDRAETKLSYQLQLFEAENASNTMHAIEQWHVATERGHEEAKAAFKRLQQTLGSLSAPISRMDTRLADIHDNLQADARMKSQDAIDGFADIDDQSWTIAQCQRVTIDLLKEYPTITIVIDALDEVLDEERQDLMTSLADIIQESMEHGETLLKIFISSRDNLDITLFLKGSPNVYIGADENHQDIRAFT
ncbi:hypothetical protein KJ359_007144 [Pestalotiopsis sp. 9143b]|nr:hypothetical protein KJ359_007144 [Pestalotiopsis sp. 9143b]